MATNTPTPSTFKPRAKQREVLAYTSGKMGVAAVPGSGKTRTLAALAAKLVTRLGDKPGAEVLIVTLVNSAVEHFSRQVGEFVKARGLLANSGYRVRTLHGLATDIVRERPALVGLSDGFAIVDERESNEILEDAMQAWLRLNPRGADEYLDPALEDNRRETVQKDIWPEALTDVMRAFIRQAKDYELDPDDLFAALEQSDEALPLAEIGYAVYANYQRGLAYRGAVDFQDLIRLALRAIRSDTAYLARLRERWPYILEDEAQDSSLLQEQILRLLSGGNWVRMGDPNQAIYETFTTARPEYLRSFLHEVGVARRELPNSGRSTRSIINLANELIRWSLEQHPVESIRDRRPLQAPYIAPAPRGDPQPNPTDNPKRVYLHRQTLTPAGEVNMVVESLSRWLPENPDQTAAVLVPRNKRGFEVIDAIKALRDTKIEYVELLRSTTSTREAAGAIANMLNYLGNPGSAPLLAIAYRVWRREDRDDPAALMRVEAIARALTNCKRVEDYLWPAGERDWLDQLTLALQDMETREQLDQFRDLVRRWQSAVMLPVDQLILTLAQDLFTSGADLAIAHSLAVLLRRAASMHPEWRLPQFTTELGDIAKNERRFLGMSEEDMGFDADRHKGKVCVATLHSAKGLEWDRVYLLSVNNYDFPSAQPYDRSISEKWFIRDALNLEAEALAQLKALHEEAPYAEGHATHAARLDYAAERLRLLYVGITRARKELMMTWNTGRQGDMQPAIPFLELHTYWENSTRQGFGREE